MSTDAAPGFRSLGQAAARRMATLGAQRGRVGRTLLVHGPPGAGKTAFVDDLLALAFCIEPDATHRPCNACRGCRDARNRSHPDLVTGSPDGWREARTTGESIVAVARRWLLEAAGAPVVADRRVVVVERVDRASEQIQNALLKTLEEPTDRHTFILVADEPSHLLPTIRSRSQPLRIGPVPREELTGHLMDVEGLPRDLADALARISNGLSGTAVAFARNRDLLDWRRRLQAELLSLLERGRADRLGAVRDLIDDAVRLVPARPADDEEARTPASVQREAAILVVDGWIGLTRDLLMAVAGRSELAPGTELGPDLERLAPGLDVPSLLAMSRRLERIHAGLRENAAPRLSLEAGMLAWPMLRTTRDR